MFVHTLSFDEKAKKILLKVCDYQCICLYLRSDSGSRGWRNRMIRVLSQATVVGRRRLPNIFVEKERYAFLVYLKPEKFLRIPRGGMMAFTRMRGAAVIASSYSGFLRTSDRRCGHTVPRFFV